MKNLPFLLALALINSCIELEISAPSFPDIQTYFSVSEERVSLTITVNLIGFCLASFFHGPLSDAYGRRRIMIMGNAILCLGSFGCVIAPSFSFLLTARLIQGIGAATSAVVVSAIITDRYKPKEASVLYSRMNAVFTVLMALSPLAGGYLNHIFGWRGNYGFVALICLGTWGMLWRYLPETLVKKQAFDLPKVISNYGRILTSRKFLQAASSPSLLYGGYIAFVSLSPFLYCHTFSLTPESYILNLGLIVGSFTLTSISSKRITSALGEQKTIYLSLVLFLLSPLMITIRAHYIFLTLGMSLFSVGFALYYPIVFSFSMTIFPKTKGAASSAIMGLRYFLCATVMGGLHSAYDGKVESFSYVLGTLICFVFGATLALIKEINNSNYKQ